jgi:hypothetical protein
MNTRPAADMHIIIFLMIVSLTSLSGHLLTKRNSEAVSISSPSVPKHSICSENHESNLKHMTTHAPTYFRPGYRVQICLNALWNPHVVIFN